MRLSIGIAGIATSAFASVIAERQTYELVVFAPLPSALTTCTNVTVSWAGGLGPYTHWVYGDGGVFEYQQTNEPSFTWNFVAAGGKQILVQVVGTYTGTGYSGGWTNTMNVTNGTDLSCVRCAKC